MDRDDVISILQEHAEEIRRFGARSLSLFGSVARGEARPGSDVDVLVEFDGLATFDRFMGLKILLEDLLGTKVDLVTLRALKPGVRPYVERELLRVA